MEARIVEFKTYKQMEGSWLSGMGATNTGYSKMKRNEDEMEH